MADESPDTKTSEPGDDEVLARANERFAYAEEADGDNRKAALDDTRFVYKRGEQWDQDTRAKRKKWRLPSLEFNQLKQFVSQVVNDQRQGRPGIKFSPAGGDASEKVAQLKQELVRGVEVKSKAEAAYDTGFLHAVVGGRGYWRIRSDYESKKSFNQCLKIDVLTDPQAVRIDPDYQEPDASDIKWGFVTEKIRKSDYERRFKGAPLSWATTEETALWYPTSNKQVVFIADYYEIVESEDELVLLDDGAVLWADELVRDQKAGKVDPKARVTKTRKATRTRCDWYTLGGGERVLERHPWKGAYVPIVACIGDEVVIDGERIYQGLIRPAREPQQLLNYGMTQMAIRLSQTPKAPWVAAKAAIKGFETLYESSNEEEYAVLPFNHVDAAGNAIPQPTRQPGSDLDVGWANWVQTMQSQIRSTIGMYENNLGMRAQETSGKAILAREAQGDNATFHYLDNLSRAIKHTGTVLDDLIPYYYDTQRMVPLIDRDGAQRMGEVNQQVPVVDPAGGDGAVKYATNPDNDLTRGEYAATVESGPSDSTKREATRETMVELFQAFPPAAQILGDKLLAVVDMPDAKEAAERFKVLLPPQIQAMEAAKAQGQRPPDPQMVQQLQQAQGQLQQMQQAMQQMQQENAQLKQGQEVKMADVQAGAAANQQKIQADAQAAIAKAQLDARTKVETTLIGVAGELYAEHLGLRAKAEAVGAPAPAQTDLGTVIEGVRGTTEQVRSSMEDGTPMPAPTLAAREPAPDTILMLEGIAAIAERVGSAIAMALVAPRKLDVQTDSMGNVIGGVSVPVTGALQ